MYTKYMYTQLYVHIQKSRYEFSTVTYKLVFHKKIHAYKFLGRNLFKIDEILFLVTMILTVIGILWQLTKVYYDHGKTIFITEKHVY